jgi:hypothetical protein
MGWIFFFIASVLVFLIFTSIKKWKHFWIGGLITMLIIYAIDSTLIRLGAYSLRYPNHLIGELPTLYWLGSYFGGIVLIYYFPERKPLQFPYILLSALLFLCLELIMCFFGYFYCHNWSPVESFFLDVFGLVVVIWLWNWINGSRMSMK